MEKKYLLKNKAHVNETAKRWIKEYVWNRNKQSEEYEKNLDEWLQQQCFKCQFYILLQGHLQTDWGVCSNQDSQLDGRLMFEHDGCEHYSFAKDEEDLNP